MKTRIVLALNLLLAAVAFVHAAPKSALTVAVYDFTDPDKNLEDYAGKVTALLTADLTAETNLVMVERADLKKSLGEQAMGASGIVSSGTAARIGQITGAKVLVSGQVIKDTGARLVVVASIVGTETGRLLAVKSEGTAENLAALTSALSREIGQKVRDQAADLLVETASHEEYLERIVKSVRGTNRPAVSVSFRFPTGRGAPVAAATEMGLILQNAGFVVVDANSDRKPSLEISGVVDAGAGPRRGKLFTSRAYVEARVRERRTGNFLAFERQTGDAAAAALFSANVAAQVQAIDRLAETILPLLAQ